MESSCRRHLLDIYILWEISQKIGRYLNGGSGYSRNNVHWKLFVAMVLKSPCLNFSIYYPISFISFIYVKFLHDNCWNEASFLKPSSLFSFSRSQTVARCKKNLLNEKIIFVFKSWRIYDIVPKNIIQMNHLPRNGSQLHNNDNCTDAERKTTFFLSKTSKFET